MKNDIKVFLLFTLTILIFGGGYYFGNFGKFIFPVDYSFLVLGAISLFFFFTTKFSKFSVFLLPLGLSFSYFLFPKEYSDIFIGTSFFSILAFTLILLSSIYRKKDNKFKYYLLSFVLVSFLSVGLLGLEINYLPVIFYGLKYFIIILIFRKDQELRTLDKGLKRVFIVLGLYYFINVLS